MSRDRETLWKRGEHEAVRYLEKYGYRIIKRNYRCKYGEVDIIAEHKRTIVFVEVKARGSHLFGGPLEAVNPRKRNSILMTSLTFLKEYDYTDRDVRFDIIGVELKEKGLSIDHLKDAFGMDDIRRGRDFL